MSQGQFSFNQDVVAVFSGFNQVFRDARPMAATVKEEAKLMEHPTERGAVITDHMVVQPVEIELVMTLTPATHRDTYQEIRRLFQAGEILTVQTRTDTYQNQVITALPHEETPEMFDTVDLTLKLKEIRIVETQFEAVYKAAEPKQAPTTERGEQQAEEQPRKSSWASRNLPF